jgi:hypothetical protein
MGGDYESLLILQEDAPRPFCPSISQETISDFIRWKRGNQDELLTDGNRNPIKDIHGNDIYCENGWKAPKVVKQFKSAVTAIHEVNHQTGPYQDKCAACLAVGMEGRGCQHHRYNPQLWRIGDPAKALAVKQAYKKSNKDGEGYQEGGDTPLTPLELMRIRARLLSTNKIADFQLWC